MCPTLDAGRLKPTALRRSDVWVDLSAIRHNVNVLTAPPAALLVMVKGDGYGHGRVEVARTVIDAGAHWLGVTFVEEGVELRQALPETPVLLTTEAAPGEDEVAVMSDLDMTVYSHRALDAIAKFATGSGKAARVHIKVNTGLNRVGASCADVLSLVRHAFSAGIEVRGLWTHFAVADDVTDPTTNRQLARLLDTVASVRAAGYPVPIVHAANTAAILAHPNAHLNMVRAGDGIYGISPGDALPRADELKPALTWRTVVRHTKPVAAGEGVSYGFTGRATRTTTVATLPVGFADGFPRILSNRAHVLINGTRRPVIGTIAMDQMMVDCGDEPVAYGDEVTLIGLQGNEVITVDELAGLAGTVADEILCGISQRVPRRYLP